jgi:glycerol-3-phosphate dehydrogenase
MTAPPSSPTRAARLAALAEARPDVLVIGGGITGAGIALDLAARGLAVVLVEKDDWAAATSSASSRLIHGGLRYLEQFEFGLVRASCLERGLLLRNAAGLVWPERFVFPLQRGRSPGRAKLAAGLALYTLVSVPRVLGWPGLDSAREVARRVPGLRTDIVGGGSYLDGATHDARLTLAVVRTARTKGVVALSRVEATAIENGARGASVRLRDVLGGTELTLEARAVVLAGGPSTDALRRLAGLPGGWIRATRGTHLVVPRERLPTDGAVIFPSPLDGRVMFLIPWPRHTVIGTTDLDASVDVPPRTTRAEVEYLLASANGLVPAAELGPDDVLGTWAGLRPLLASDAENPSAVSREERIEREGALYTIAGGKLTAYRAMAEELGARVARDLGRGDGARHSPTRSLALVGAHARPVARPAWSSLGATGALASARDALAVAWERRYAALAPQVAEACRQDASAREPLDPETLLGEVDWAVEHEDCLSARDFFLRRTDLGYTRQTLDERLLASVCERLARGLGWSRERAEADRRALRSAFDGLHAWRENDSRPAVVRRAE